MHVQLGLLVVHSTCVSFNNGLYYIVWIIVLFKLCVYYSIFFTCSCNSSCTFSVFFVNKSLECYRLANRTRSLAIGHIFTIDMGVRHYNALAGGDPM